MKELNKTKLVITIMIVLVVTALIILGVIFVNSDKSENKNNISTESEFEALEIKNIQISYSEESSQTNLNFAIKNVTSEKLEKQKIDIQLINENGGVISQVKVNVNSIEPEGSYPVNMTLGGNIQGIKKIKILPTEEVVNEQ